MATLTTKFCRSFHRKITRLLSLVGPVNIQKAEALREYRLIQTATSVHGGPANHLSTDSSSSGRSRPRGRRSSTSLLVRSNRVVQALADFLSRARQHPVDHLLLVSCVVRTYTRRCYSSEGQVAMCRCLMASRLFCSYQTSP